MISAPACYGKIPDYGDFYQYRASGPSADAWWSWFARAREHCDFSSGAYASWCFALPPGVMRWSGGHFVIGVLAKSQDRVGRAFPLVVWQTAPARSILEMLKQAAESPMERDWLFWFSRLAATFAAGRADQGFYPGPEADFGQRLDRIWQVFRPGWLTRWGLGKSRAPSPGALEMLAGGREDDGLQGVRRLPWADWPDRLGAPGATPCFWAMDNGARYLKAVTGASLDEDLLTRLF